MHRSGKSEAQYHIDTTNVLFILSGAFVGLDDVVRLRLAENRGVSGLGITSQCSYLFSKSMGFTSNNYFTAMPKVQNGLDQLVDPTGMHL